MRCLLSVTLLAVLMAGCNRQQVSPGYAINSGSPVLRIAVFADGRLTIDGAPASIPQLREALGRLAEKKGSVLYYREAAQQEPPPIATEVMTAIIDARLPIRLSTRPDYSDAN